MAYFRAIRKYRQEGRPIIYVKKHLYIAPTRLHVSGQMTVSRESKLPYPKANVSLSFMEVTN
jgi:hypothetical protein